MKKAWMFMIPFLLLVTSSGWARNDATLPIQNLWAELNWDTLTGAEVVATLSPHISSKDMKMDRVNRLKIDPAILESRRTATGKITFRIDGPTIMTNWYDASYWWSGNEEATEDKAPRLVIMYGARDPVQDPEP